MGILNNKPALQQAIQHHVVDHNAKLLLHPDFGVAVQAGYTARVYGNQTEAQNLWEYVEKTASGVFSSLQNFFNADALKANDQYLDVYARGPNGVHLFPNVRVPGDQMQNIISGDLKRWLDDGHPLSVRFSFDGGRATHINIISATKLNITAQKAIDEIAHSLPGGGFGDNSPNGFGNIPTSSSSPTQSFMPNLSAAKNSGLTADKRNYIIMACRAFGVDPNLVAAIMENESRFDPSVVSGAGAVGLMQLEPGTYHGQYNVIGKKYNLVDDIYNVRTNIYCGTYYISILKAMKGGDLRKTIASYNAGPYAKSFNYPETRAYIVNVMQSYKKYLAQTAANQGSPLDKRPETKKQDKTNSTAQSGHMQPGSTGT